MRRNPFFHPGQKAEPDHPQMPLPQHPQLSKLSPESPHFPAPPPIWTRYIDSRFKQFIHR
ncbi:MAG TPA: hypothetical protein VHY37_07925 [Tepidisphaeraceae bacterium]|nr:hypothetical protein [Tepidisphaeraceae bacterium]